MHIKLLLLVLCSLIVLSWAKTKHQKMYEDLYLLPEETLLDQEFISIYANLLHRNILAEFLIPSPAQQETWGNRNVFVLINPQLVNLALATQKYKLAHAITEEIIRRHPRGYDHYPDYASYHFPLTTPDDPYYQKPHRPLPAHWIEHQFLKISLVREDRHAFDLRGVPSIAICVLNEDPLCYETLQRYDYQAALCDNQTMTVDGVAIATSLSIPSAIPPLVEMGAPFEGSERNHILSQVTPFLHACTTGSVPMVAKLAQMGLDIDQQESGHGDTCLHIAAMRNHIALIEWLLQHNADITIVNQQDRHSAYSLSVQYHHREAQTLIAEQFLKERLPLPRPPTLRERLQDLNTHDDVAKYLYDYAERMNVTRELMLQSPDVAHYDPVYDFNGTYSTELAIGNEDRSMDPDIIPGNNFGSFFIELDGVLYRAGTYSLHEKLAQRKAQEQAEKYQAKLLFQQERNELADIVKQALQEKERRLADDDEEANAAAYQTMLPKHKEQMAEELEKNRLLNERYKQSLEALAANRDDISQPSHSTKDEL